MKYFLLAIILAFLSSSFFSGCTIGRVRTTPPPLKISAADQRMFKAIEALPLEERITALEQLSERLSAIKYSPAPLIQRQHIPIEPIGRKEVHFENPICCTTKYYGGESKMECVRSPFAFCL